MTQTAQELFEKGGQVYLRNPQTDSEHGERLQTYLTAMGKKGPFYVIKAENNPSSHDHPQILTLGRDMNTAIQVRYGHEPSEDLMVSGFWLTAKPW